ncbi:hypothetical protein JCM33374_g3616 [Metschnikowia sp. JCM 33374]|nr:hypothetical protein JCM33374_g3616 [Metschnikowia sp. JCM 33374]
MATITSSILLHLIGMSSPENTNGPEVTPKHTDLEASNEENSGVGFDLFLWSRCFKICEKSHSQSLPCFTMADFNAFLTSHPQNFVTHGCGALELYNEIFGKQDLTELLLKKKDEGPEDLKKVPFIHSEQSSIKSSDFGSFLDEAFIVTAVDEVSKFLQIDFPNPLNPIFCSTSRKREAYNSVKYYIGDVDYACLSVPTFLRKVKSTFERVEELKTSILTEASAVVTQDFKDEVAEVVHDSQKVLTVANQIIQTIETGNELIQTLSTWSNYECTLAEVHDLLKKRQEAFVATTPFDNIQKLKELCDYSVVSSQTVAGTVEILENVPSEISSSGSSFRPYSSALSMKSAQGKAVVVDVSQNSFSGNTQEAIDYSESE